ncbi:hypothetical protein M3Y99_01404300 [Aphelenchoides fujianensis]|nr:hypothetical protein M3Y99_01404300 [Aphelenchoides fujianensis]
MKSTYKPPQQPPQKYGPSSGVNIGLGHPPADARNAPSAGYSQQTSNVWASAAARPVPDVDFVDRSRPCGLRPASAYGYDQRAMPPTANYYDNQPRYGEYRTEQAPQAPMVDPYAAATYGAPMRPMYEPPRQIRKPGARGNFNQPARRSYGGGPPMNNAANRNGPNRGPKRPFQPQQNKGGFANKRPAGNDQKRVEEAKKKPGGTAGKPVAPAAGAANKDKKEANGSAAAPAKDANKPNGNNNAAAKGPAEKKADRPIPKLMSEDLPAYFETTKKMGETRRRAARFKLYRVDAKGMEHEEAAFDCATGLMLKLNKDGPVPVGVHRQHAKQCVKMLIEEVNKHEFTPQFKEGKEESAEQAALLQSCIDAVAERVRNGDFPPPPVKKNVVESAEAAAESAPTDAAEEPKPSETAEGHEQPAAEDGESAAKRAKVEPEETHVVPDDLNCTDEA